MRTPNCKCVICGKPLYRRPFELKKIRYVACMTHREDVKRMVPLTTKQQDALMLGRKKGTNHRTGYTHREESKRKASESHRRWCAENPDKCKTRGEKTRGEKHYNWKGGATRLNVSIRQMNENRRWMDAVKERDERCVRCGSENNLESHHIVSLAELIVIFEIRNRDQARKCKELWDISNGETLCGKCHYSVHGRRYAD